MKTRTFDYVIIGGGAAGCVIAARLAADSDGTVALLERGRADKNRWLHIPGGFFKAITSQDAETVVSDHDPSLGGLPYAVPQGRVLGGGSSVNGMVYMRGQHRDYDDWVSEHGCTGWSYKDVLPVFRRQECNIDLDDEYHGTSGPLIVSNPSAPHPVSAAAIEAAVAWGLPRTRDFNGAAQEGAGWYQVTAYKGQRQSAAHCFLKPQMHRENLTVLTGHHVERIRFANRRAHAVEVRDTDGTAYLFESRREIILSAGSFQSPKLLMLSGIGPAAELLRHGIDVVHDAVEVGANFQDHVGTPVTRHLKGIRGYHNQDKGFAALKHGINYFGFRRGVLTSNILDAGVCADTSGGGRPDVQFNLAPFAAGRPGKAPIAHNAMQVHPMTMRGRSRGRLGLRSRDPLDHPAFHSDALGHEADLDTLRRGVRLAREIYDQPPLKEITGDEIWPGKDVSSARGSNTLDDAIRSQARTIFHPSCTCRMGPTEAAVVDLNLRVYGTEGLRVADCSIMPALTSGNTNAPTMMIGDQAADFILNDPM